jgi:hypothetical protein
MWNDPLSGYSAIILEPYRDFVLDPSFAIANISILPPVTRHPHVDSVFSTVLYYLLAPLRELYRAPTEDAFDLRDKARNDIIIDSKAGIGVPFRPPSDLASAIRGALAFIISATADTVGTIMDRQKNNEMV